MESSSCLSGCGTTSYIFLSVAIAEWFVYSVAQLNYLDFSRASLWNMSVSSLSAIIWLKIPMIWLSYSNNWSRTFCTLCISNLVLAGPLLLSLNFLGSYWDAIDYKSLCDYECTVAVVLKDFHWTFLYFLSLMSTTVLFLFVYFRYWGSRQSIHARRSLIPLDCYILEGKEEDPCAICLQSMNKAETVGLIRKCKHLYHKTCIEEWLSFKDKCPICRTVV